MANKTLFATTRGALPPAANTLNRAGSIAYEYSPKQKLLSEHYHNELTAAMAAKDAERAELIMKEHVYEARDHLLATIEAEATQKGDQVA